MMEQPVQACDAPVRGNQFRDLTGRRFGRLTVLRLTGDKAADGCYYWLCRCECGKETTVSSNKLLQGRTLSCGCYGRERREKSRTYVGGTCLEIAYSKKLPVNNTSGARGVSRSRGLWLAKISFARKQFFLGRYRNFGEAVAIYRKAEALRDEVLDEIGELQEEAVHVFASRLMELRELNACSRPQRWRMEQ